MKADIERLKKIKRYCKQLINFTKHIKFENFATDEKTNYACVFALSQIGELANKLSDSTKSKSEIPWHAIVAIRHRIVHGYDGLNMKIIWDTIKLEIPNLILKIDEIIILNQIVEICKQNENTKEIILYGSRAKGTHMPKSDFDIALKGININIEKLRDEIEFIETLLKIDLVNIDETKNELLKKEVEKYGITLYSKI